MRNSKTIYDAMIVGGGITGAATAYSLAIAGQRRTLLLERNTPGGGATAKAATLISQARSNADVIPYVAETCRQIDRLAAGDPGRLGFCRVGAVHAAGEPAGIESLEKTFAVSRSRGVAGREISPRHVRQLLPWIREKALAKAYFYEDDGYVDGHLLTMAYLDAAKETGLRALSRCAVTSIIPLANGYEAATECGVFRARNVIVAAGAWSNLLLAPLGVCIPFAPVRSQYWITGSNPALFPARQPLCVLPDARAYTRPENGSLVFGWREPQCVHVDARELPAEVFAYRFAEDGDGWQNLEGCAECLEPYFPDIATQGIAHYVTGCSTYAPDGVFSVGGLPGFPGLYAAAGCAGMGIAACGGIGRAVAESIAYGVTDLPVRPFSPERFGKVNVFSEKFMRACADARSGKKTG